MKLTKNIKRFRPIRPAKRIEVLYRSELMKVVDTIKDTIYTHLESDLPTSKQLELALGDIDRINIEQFSKITGNKILKTASTDNLNKIVKDLESKGVSLNQVRINNLNNFDKINKTFGQSLNENTLLIKSVRNELRHDIEKVLNETVFNKDLGRRDILNDISEKLEISKNRAKVIARDQSAKINAQLSEDRYTHLGIDIYEWHTSQDGRVRSNHRGLNKTLCKYSDPSVYSTDGGKTWKSRGNLYKGKPAEDYQCRCIAIAVMPFNI